MCIILTTGAEKSSSSLNLLIIVENKNVPYDYNTLNEYA